jgi:ribosome modulation factor
MAAMVRELIEALSDVEAGRYIAEKVMGWKCFRTPDCPKWVWINADGKFAAYDNWFPRLDEAIEAAKKVGLAGFSLECCPDANGKPVWYAGWGELTDVRRSSSSFPVRAVVNAVIAAHEARKEQK